MIAFQKKSLKPVETLIILLLFITIIASSQPDLLKLAGNANLIVMLHISLQCFQWEFCVKRCFFGFLQSVFKILQKAELFS